MLVPLHQGRLLQPGGVRRGYNEGGGKDCERIKPLPLFDVLAHTQRNTIPGEHVQYATTPTPTPSSHIIPHQASTL